MKLALLQQPLIVINIKYDGNGKKLQLFVSKVFINTYISIIDISCITENRWRFPLKDHLKKAFGFKKMLVYNIKNMNPHYEFMLTID